MSILSRSATPSWALRRFLKWILNNFFLEAGIKMLRVFHVPAFFIPTTPKIMAIAPSTIPPTIVNEPTMDKIPIISAAMPNPFERPCCCGADGGGGGGGPAGGVEGEAGGGGGGQAGGCPGVPAPAGGAGGV